MLGFGFGVIDQYMNNDQEILEYLELCVVLDLREDVDGYGIIEWKRVKVGRRVEALEFLKSRGSSGPKIIRSEISEPICPRFNLLLKFLVVVIHHRGLARISLPSVLTVPFVFCLFAFNFIFLYLVRAESLLWNTTKLH